MNIVVIPALRATPAAEPVFWLEGGPGGAATQSAGPVSQNYLRALRNDHDLVFVDERGTGKSNPLKCDDIGENPANLDAYFGKLFPPQMIRACREKLEKTADLTRPLQALPPTVPRVPATNKMTESHQRRDAPASLPPRPGLPCSIHRADSISLSPFPLPIRY